jgi:DNA-directed RNA polymerase subunit N (RpoN/RPB10)
MAGIGHNNPTVTINALSIEDRKKLRKTLEALNDSFTRVAAERDLQKEAIGNIFDELGVDKRLVRRMAKAYFKANYNEEVEQNRNFEEFYDLIVKNTVS